MIEEREMLAILHDAARRGLNTEKLTYLSARLKNGNGDLSPETAEKVQQIIMGVYRRERNLTEEVRRWITTTEAWFSTNQCDKEVGIETSADKTARRKIFQRLVESVFIEKDKQREGYFRKVDSDLEEINILKDEGEEKPLRLPFGLHEYIKIFPKNIIIVAGEPNAGKTAFLLNIAQENQDTMEVDYFSSEMGRPELRERLSKFDWPLDAWKVRFYERAGGFDTVLNPNHLTIIDFLEVYEEFWKVGLFIRQIYDKLDQGVAIVAIQKNQTRKLRDGSISGEYGLGGQRGLEKARLYCTMGHGKIKIVKGKNWRTGVNPNGLQREFKLVSGCSFRPVSGWYKADDDPDFVKEI